MGYLKNARQRGREAGYADPLPAAPEKERVFYDLRGVRFAKYCKPVGHVDVARLGAKDPATWSLVWRCIKRSRPQLAALLMDPQIAAIKEAFDVEAMTVDFSDTPETTVMVDAYYIDTRPGADGPFTPPPATEDCAAWLRSQYAAGQQRGGGAVIYVGLAQRVNALVNQAKATARDRDARPLRVRVIGPHGEAVRAFLAQMSDGVIDAELLP